MSPLPELLWARSVPANETVTKPTNVDGLILEAWAEGYMVGSLIILSCITFANMRKGVLLHKLILLEVSLVPPPQQLCAALTDIPLAGPWLLAGLLHLLSPAHLCLVAFGGCNST